MGEKRYTIGEVSRITGVSKDTLRFYDKIDLFKPSFVDPQNGYRYYTYDQFIMGKAILDKAFKMGLGAKIPL